MSYIEKLQQIIDLQVAIKQRGTIPVDLLKKINYKLRLEWNYTSNSMEGNSLTKRETRTVMVGLIDVNNKPLKDIIEIKNHDKVISTIMKIGKGELNISESRIKEIHTGIMYEEDPEKQQYIGQWKNVDNYMYNNQGERYDFVPHTEVQQRMRELVNWTNTEKDKIARSKKGAIHPISLALKFHLDYLNVHPFYDGNGRTARILTNLILISYGYPPVYIKESEKDNYYNYLTDIQSYGGDDSLFNEFMAGLLIRSLQITLDTLEGKEIEEQDDFVKEIQLLKTKSDNKGVPKSPKVIYDTFKRINIDLWHKLKETLNYFDDFFNENKDTHTVNNTSELFVAENTINILSSFSQSDESDKLRIFGYDVYESDIKKITWQHKMFTLKGAEYSVDSVIVLKITFDHYKYIIDINSTLSDGRKPPRSICYTEKKYDLSLLPEEIEEFNSILRKHLIDEIKERIDGSDIKKS